MVTILVRTVIIYFMLSVAMRIMGKRQIGELELSELIITLMLSELGALPITDPDIPIMYAVIPIITLITLETLSSVLLIKIPWLKNLISSRPNIIIKQGRLDQRELKKLRMSTDELMIALRQQSITDLSQICYAIVEENGSLTVIPWAKDSQPTASQLGLTPTEAGMSHILVSDGKINAHGLDTVGLDRNWLDVYLGSHSCSVKDVFLLLRDDRGSNTLIMKDGI